MGDTQLLDETAKVRDDATDESRRNAKARSIAVFLPTMSEAELDELDAELLRILGRRA